MKTKATGDGRMGEYYAHSKDNELESSWQKLDTHLNNVADMAGDFASKFNSSEWGGVLGKLHDLGKYSDAFQQKIRGKNVFADHSTPGAKYAEILIREPRGAGRLLAYCIAGHHTGLPDGDSGDDDSCLIKRLGRCTSDYREFPIEISSLRPPRFLQKAAKLGERGNIGFSASFFIRMIYSCLVDADFLDTEAFIDPERASQRGKYPSLNELKPVLDTHLDALITNASQSEINKHRASILKECRASAEKEAGLFSLTVPTGGGKTLSSLAFAIDHALNHGMERVIYVIPYTSIIEQTAGIFKSIFGAHAILEHHSNIIIEKDAEDEELEENRRLSAENWDAPIIVTTNVQFFESFFANRSSKSRKLHNVARSVVILDEAQMLPVPFLRPTMAVIRELAENYGSTVVLCTATQPALTERADFKNGLSGVREMMSDPGGLERAFKRVDSENIGIIPDDDLIKRLKREEQALCVVNTKKHARLIFEGLGGDDGSFHLSAAMCPKHRRSVLGEIHNRLKEKRTCRVVSTQLVEAGVDLDFPVVFRSLAGMDSIIQAAGRCNREGKITKGGRLFVFESEESLPPGHLRQNAEITKLILNDYADDLLNTKIVENYFKELYWLKDASGKLDTKNILARLKNGLLKGDFPFKSIALDYNIIANAQETVIIPYDKEAKEHCSQLVRYIQLGWSPGGILRNLQPYTVQTYKKPLEALIQHGFITVVDERFFILSDLGRKEAYDDRFGLNPEIRDFIAAENLMY
ncbi:MAG: CRISPR-associated helicase Cas3' [Spirochaetales bacterium]|nr:CRISPR-associated helicase Cas3' [Spirochaetales bacterium]